VTRFDDIDSPSFPSTGGAAASAVVGQPDFTANMPECAPSDACVGLPLSVYADDTGLYVGNSFTLLGVYRIAYFPPAEAARPTGARVAFVYGQADPWAAVPLSSLGATATSCNVPAHLAPLSPGRALLSSHWDGRVVVYPIPPTADFVSAVDIFGKPALDSSLNVTEGPGYPDPSWIDRALSAVYDPVTNALWTTAQLRLVKFASVLPLVRNDLTSLDVVLEFEGFRNPVAVLLPKGARPSLPIPPSPTLYIFFFFPFDCFADRPPPSLPTIQTPKARSSPTSANSPSGWTR
jgi:hypothetical protein